MSGWGVNYCLSTHHPRPSGHLPPSQGSTPGSVSEPRLPSLAMNSSKRNSHPVENADVVAVVVAETDCSVCRPAAVVVDWGIAYGDGLGTDCARAACISSWMAARIAVSSVADSPATLAETVVATDMPAEKVADEADGSGAPLSMLTMVYLTKGRLREGYLTTRAVQIHSTA